MMLRTGGDVRFKLFDEAIDIHHVFTRAWCEEKKIKPSVYTRS